MGTGRSASFRLRFRFVSCVRAGEAKLRGRVMAVIFLSLGLAGESFVAPPPPPPPAPLRGGFRSIFADRRAGFKGFCYLFTTSRP